MRSKVRSLKKDSGISLVLNGKRSKAVKVKGPTPVQIGNPAPGTPQPVGMAQGRMAAVIRAENKFFRTLDCLEIQSNKRPHVTSKSVIRKTVPTKIPTLNGKGLKGYKAPKNRILTNADRQAKAEGNYYETLATTS